jgi:hypothetical protein
LLVGLDQQTKQRIAKPEEQHYLELLTDQLTARNASWSDLRGNFWRQVAQEGHNIQEAGKLDKAWDEAIKAAYKEARDEVKEEQIAGIETAPDISQSKFEELNARKDLSIEERWAVQRFSLARFYELPITRKLIEEDNEGRARAHTIAFIAATDLEWTKIQDRAEYDLENTLFGLGRAKMLGDCRNLVIKTNLRLEVLEQAGLLDQHGQPDFTGKITKRYLLERGFDKWVAANRDRLSRVLGIQSKSDAGLTRIVTSVLGHYGIECNCHQYRTGETYIDPDTGKQKAVREREYSVNAESYQKTSRLAAAHLAAIKAKAGSGLGKGEGQRAEPEPDTWTLAV